jgi:hypothetical protein
LILAGPSERGRAAGKSSRGPEGDLPEKTPAAVSAEFGVVKIHS